MLALCTHFVRAHMLMVQHADGACSAMHTCGADTNDAGVMHTLCLHTRAELDVYGDDLRRLRHERRHYRTMNIKTIVSAVGRNTRSEDISSRRRTLKEARAEACAQGGVHASRRAVRHQATHHVHQGSHSQCTLIRARSASSRCGTGAFHTASMLAKSRLPKASAKSGLPRHTHPIMCHTVQQRERTLVQEAYARRRRCSGGRRDDTRRAAYGACTGTAVTPGKDFARHKEAPHTWRQSSVST